MEIFRKFLDFEFGTSKDPEKFTDYDGVVSFMISRTLKKIIINLKILKKIINFTQGWAKFAQPGWANQNLLNVVYSRVLQFARHDCIPNIDFMPKTFILFKMVDSDSK